MCDTANLNSISKCLASTKRSYGPKVISQYIKTPIGGLSISNSDFANSIINIKYNLTPAELYEYILNEDNGIIVNLGAIACYSGQKTGRSPKDKCVVKSSSIEKFIWRDGESPNNIIEEESYLLNREIVINYLLSKKNLFVIDGFAGWDTKYRIKIRIITERPYHALFMHNMLVRPTKEEKKHFGDPDFTIYNAGKFACNRLIGINNSSTCVAFHFERKEAIILGTQYAGEMKKGIFTVMHYLMPHKDILSLHSSANMGKKSKNVTLFFGTSGTGKTTLAADPKRKLIGDDEHCWTDNGIFNIEGGCYAKCIKLRQDKEPEIWDAIRFGSILENVIVNKYTREVDFYDDSITENTRCSYPIDYIKNVQIPCVGNHPTNIIFLTCDAFGVLPAVSKLTLEQAMYYFISGYTAKIAGTEVGITEPTATFSACFGGAFLVWHPLKYAELLQEKLKKYNCQAWLINTGWYGGSYGSGERFPLPITRKIIDTIHNDNLTNVEYEKLPIFNLEIPTRFPDINNKYLNPQISWNNKDLYNQKLKHLSKLFKENYKKYRMKGDEKVFKSGPE
jgi:phosphoenolpyruvate carboxykinase (ATP)